MLLNRFALHQERDQLKKAEIVITLRYKPLRAVHPAVFAGEIWANAVVNKAINTMGSKVGLGLSLLKSHFEKYKDIGDYEAAFVTKSDGLAGMQLPIAEEILVEIFLISLYDER